MLQVKVCLKLSKNTSFSQSHRTVMIAKITVWTAVPPKIIPPQIPCPHQQLI